MSERQRLEATLRNKRDLVDGLREQISDAKRGIAKVDADRRGIEKALASSRDPRVLADAQMKGPDLDRQRSDLERSISSCQREIGRLENEIRGLESELRRLR